MAARGEACFQQKHQRHRFDVGYDLVFDPDAVDYCTFFSKAIIPAKHCGASCPAFKPLDRTSSTDNSDAHVRHSRPLTNSTASLTSHLMRSHRSLWQRLEIVSNQLRSREHSLEEQAKEQARRWQQLDKQLKQTQRRSDRLVKRLALAELASADTEIGNDEAQPTSRPDVSRGDPHEQHELQFRQQQWAIRVKDAKLRGEHVKAQMTSARTKLEAQRRHWYNYWEVTTERKRLLMYLRSELLLRVEARLADYAKPMTEVNHINILGFLKDVASLAMVDAADAAPIAAFRKKVDDLTARSLRL